MYYCVITHIVHACVCMCPWWLVTVNGSNERFWFYMVLYTYKVSGITWLSVPHYVSLCAVRNLLVPVQQCCAATVRDTSGDRNIVLTNILQHCYKWYWNCLDIILLFQESTFIYTKDISIIYFCEQIIWILLSLLRKLEAKWN